MKEKVNSIPKSDSSKILTDGIVAIGRVVKAQGLRGEVKIEKLSNVTGRYKFLEKVTLEFKNAECIQYDVEYTKIKGVYVILKLNGIDNSDDAELLRGAYVNVLRENVAPLTDNSYYTFDLENMNVFDSFGKKIGFVKRVAIYPANEVIIIEKEDEDIMIPAIKEYIVDINIKENKLTVNLPEGLPTYPNRV